jgi:transcriptional regulator with XRE-family HTH domain
MGLSGQVSEGRPFMVVRAAQAVPNALLRQAREARNQTQDEVADSLIQLGASGVTGGLVSKWERGICGPTAFHRRLLCQFFEATREELGFSGPGRPVADLPDERSNEDMDRRLFVKLFGATAGTALFSPELLELLRTLEGSGVGRNSLSYLEEKAASIEAQYASVGPHSVRAPTLALLRQVTAQLDRPQTVKARRRLSAVAAQLAAQMRYVSWDLREHDAVVEAASDWCRVAMEAALEAGDDGRCAYVLGSRSLLSTYQGNPKEALTYIGGAQRFAARTTSAALPAWLSSLEARAHAEMNEERACDAALRRAAERIEQIRPERRRAGVDFFDRPRFVSTQGTCNMILGRPEAVPVLTEALSLHPPTHQRYRSLTLLELALAQAELGEPEAALESTTKALSIPREQRVGELLKRERQLHVRLGKWGTEPAVKEARERLTA